MLDARLSLARSLYDSCDCGADIGTDHGLLPCKLLLDNVCRRMILADISDKALDHARGNVARYHLGKRVDFRCADGLAALSEPCGCISILGMGGEMIATILQSGKEKLQGASLVLSAHTDLHLVREAVTAIGYHFTEERICLAGGRYYVVWKAVPGAAPLSAQEIETGTPLLYQTNPENLEGYLTWRISVLERKLAGLRQGTVPPVDFIAALETQLAIMRRHLDDHRTAGL